MKRTGARIRDGAGFTLIELAYVVAILSVLTAFAVPAYDAVWRRAQAAEAEAGLYAIAHAELRAFRDGGAFIPCAYAGPVPAGPERFPADEACWTSLEVQFEGSVRYRYAVSVDDDTFVVQAEGDLDGDGDVSRWSLSSVDLALSVEDRLE